MKIQSGEKIRVLCLGCQAENRVEASRAAHETAVCGRCKVPLDLHASGFPQDVSQSGFSDAVLKSPVPVLVDFWAEWCGPCRAMHPTFEGVAREMAGKVKFVRVNVDEAQSLAGQMRISSIPTLVLFRDGKEIGRVSGSQPASSLKAFLQQKI